jgi:hypothetical protein
LHPVELTRDWYAEFRIAFKFNQSLMDACQKVAMDRVERLITYSPCPLDIIFATDGPASHLLG